MRAIFILLSFACLTCEAKVFILLDPGHGGKDRGTIKNHLVESDLVLKLALKLEKLLVKDPRFQVNLTRRDDHFLTLSSRAEMARQLKADLLLSLHANFSTEPKARGVEIYFQNQLPPDEESMFLANRENQEKDSEFSVEDSLAGLRSPALNNKDVRLILDDLLRNHRIQSSSQLARSLWSNWRGPRKSKSASIKQAPFHVISQVGVPSALVEVGFLSNPEDSELLRTDDHQSAIAEGIYEGLVKFSEFMDSSAHAF